MSKTYYEVANVFRGQWYRTGIMYSRRPAADAHAERSRKRGRETKIMIWLDDGKRLVSAGVAAALLAVTVACGQGPDRTWEIPPVSIKMTGVPNHEIALWYNDYFNREIFRFTCGSADVNAWMVDELVLDGKSVSGTTESKYGHAHMYYADVRILRGQSEGSHNHTLAHELGHALGFGVNNEDHGHEDRGIMSTGDVQIFTREDFAREMRGTRLEAWIIGEYR